jgi:RNA polymerase sigma-70 factor (ECF subfamily)
VRAEILEFHVPFAVVDAKAAGGAEGELVERVRRGEPAAVAEIYDAHHEHVRALARRLLGDESLAEDLVHDAFVALPRAIGRFRGDSSLRTFLAAIVVNHVRHHLRSAVRRRRAHARLGADPPPSSPDLEDEVERRRLARVLTCALGTLPIEQRVAVVLCGVEGRTSAEAAQIVGVPEGTIRTRLFHGKRKLREALEALAEGGLS